MTKSNCFILSCDGGGIRGVITALLLEDLEAKCPGFLSKVALFAGTSTGGIIALGLAAGYPISQIRAIYENDAGQIFTPYQPGILDLLKYVREYVNLLLAPSPAAAPAAPAATPAPAAELMNISSILQTIEHVFHVKYQADGLTAVLTTVFGTKRLNDLRPVLVTTYNFAPKVGPSWQPLLLMNQNSHLNTDHSNMNVPTIPAGNILALDAALATGAAPTFFPPHEVTALGFCTDGGLFANNPSLFALNSVISPTTPMSSCCVLSLGTGSVPQKVTAVNDPLAWGIGPWMLPKPTTNIPQLLLLQMLMDGQAQIADAQCAGLLGNRYLRVNPRLSTMFPLDGIQFIPQMVKETEDYIAGKNPQPGVPPWHDVVDWVGNNI